MKAQIRPFSSSHFLHSLGFATRHQLSVARTASGHGKAATVRPAVEIRMTSRALFDAVTAKRRVKAAFHARPCSVVLLGPIVAASFRCTPSR